MDGANKEKKQKTKKKIRRDEEGDDECDVCPRQSVYRLLLTASVFAYARAHVSASICVSVSVRV